MKIFIFSEKLYEKHGKNWHVGGFDISYSQNGIKKETAVLNHLA
jgi:hypothetical protein